MAILRAVGRFAGSPPPAFFGATDFFAAVFLVVVGSSTGSPMLCALAMPAARTVVVGRGRALLADLDGRRSLRFGRGIWLGRRRRRLWRRWREYYDRRRRRRRVGLLIEDLAHTVLNGLRVDNEEACAHGNKEGWRECDGEGRPDRRGGGGASQEGDARIGHGSENWHFVAGCVRQCFW